MDFAHYWFSQDAGFTPNNNFETLLGSGGSILGAAQSKFARGLYWIKDRDNVNPHQLLDVQRGNLALDTSSPGTKQFAYSAPAGNSVAWCWRAGDTTVTNNDGTIESQVCANVEAGFSIITYHGSGQFSNQNIGHGLGVAPSMVTIAYTDGKVASGVSQWYTYHVSTGNNSYMRLNSTGGVKGSSSANQGGPDFVTDKIIQFRKGSSSIANVNSSNLDYVCYAWAEVPGYSAFGSYVGNANNVGPTVATGFLPKFLLVKRAGSGSWVIIDSLRSTSNPRRNYLYAENDRAEASTNPDLDVDFLANGFQIRNNATNMNLSGVTYIYMCFAA